MTHPGRWGLLSCLPPYPSGPFTTGQTALKLMLVNGMQTSGTGKIQRRGERKKAVLPVRIKGTDGAGKPFEELAHTLDVTATGVRLGAVRRELNLDDEITLFYRQRKMQYRVVWTKKMKGSSEFQVGLKALAQDREAWGMSFEEQGRPPVSLTNISRMVGIA